MPAEVTKLTLAQKIEQFRSELAEFASEAPGRTTDVEALNAFSAANRERKERLKKRAVELGLDYPQEATEACERARQKKQELE